MSRTFPGRDIQAAIDRLEELETQLATLSAEVRELAAAATMCQRRNYDPPAPVLSRLREHHDPISIVPPELFLG